VVIRAIVRTPDTSLRPGMFARVRLITREVQDALVLPEQALVPQGDSQYVYRIVDGKAVRTKVEVGQRRDARVELLNGVTKDDMVVIAGQLKLRDGAPVTVLGGAAEGTATAPASGLTPPSAGATELKPSTGAPANAENTPPPPPRKS
jgi:membrane fusion protein (multidrug efflux system)